MSLILHNLSFSTANRVLSISTFPRPHQVFGHQSSKRATLHMGRKHGSFT